MARDTKLHRGHFLGLFMVSMATLFYEILLTRIFSVVMWYHFAFMVISLALFGMTVGGLMVYLFPRRFPHESTHYHLALTAFLFAVSIVLSFLTAQSIPFISDTSLSVIVYYAMGLTFIVVAAPFVFSGICICLALTRFPEQVSKLYAFNLAGAGAGCLVFTIALRIVDGPSAVLLSAAVAAAGAVFLAHRSLARKLKYAGAIGAVVLVGLLSVNAYLAHVQRPLLRLLWIQGAPEPRPLYEKWNPFSRVVVRGDPARLTPPWIHGMSPAYQRHDDTHQLMLLIDVIGAALMFQFDGDFGKLDFLHYPVSNLAHRIRPDSNVLVVGVGGGQDILSALLFQQKSVTGVEINETVVDLITNQFSDFMGHFDRLPNVRIVNDEGRSWVARQSDRFDIIQLTFVDTFAASASGAFVLTENSLYTVEAFETFLNHLSDHGVFTVTHYYHRGIPAQMYRMCGLATQALRALGVQDPRRHVVLVRCPDDFELTRGMGIDDVGTFLISRAPFSDRDLDAIDDIARRLQYDVVFSPRTATDPNFATIAAGKTLDELSAEYSLKLDAPTDDSPFFFHNLKLSGVANPNAQKHGMLSVNIAAVRLLLLVLGMVTALTIGCIILPLLLISKTARLLPAFPFLLFFAAIGLGFMFIEIAQIQRMSIFLGYPTYGLSVVLFTLLLAGGLGSHSTRRIGGAGSSRSVLTRMGLLLLVLSILGVGTPYVAQAFQAATTPIRIAVAVATLFPMGFLMGMAFPIGMKGASTHAAVLTPWFWGINGATSVCASVLAVVIAMGWGITASFYTGVLCYVVAVAALVWQRKAFA